MRVGIFSNNVRRSLEVKAALTRRFLERHFIIDDENPEVVVTIGGDGTLLYILDIWDFIQIGVTMK